MPIHKLTACTATPLGGYLKALGFFRLVSEQADGAARGWWESETFHLDSKLSAEELVDFFLSSYSPTPIVAPWNGGSGFYPKDNREGIDAIAASEDRRFAAYRATVETCREFPEVRTGKSAIQDEDTRRAAIQRRCRNELCEGAVEWLDAAVGIAADGTRSFAPVLGTGGNEGRLDYTNNFMARVSGLLLTPDKQTVGLLRNALWGDRTTALQEGAAGQYDPGRSGGPNQGPGVAHGAATNPWDLVLTLEGAVSWSSGLYRRQGAACRGVLCSPFTVRARNVGYGSASSGDEARAEIWTPLWPRPVAYPELKTLLREGRASLDGRPARNTMEFAEAASSLGVDRGIDRFVRYSILMRRGKSYIALPAGTFPAHYRRNVDCIRKLQTYLDSLHEAPNLVREVESAMYQALLKEGQAQMTLVVAALGRLLRSIATKTETPLRTRAQMADDWLGPCGFENDVNVRIAASLASIHAWDTGSILQNLSKGGQNLSKGGEFAWTGIDLMERMTSVLWRRIRMASANESRRNPLGGACEIDAGDVTRFIEGSVDDRLIEDLLFGFLVLDWKGFERRAPVQHEVLPAYAVLKCLFLPGKLRRGLEPVQLVADPRILSSLAAGRVGEATTLAVRRLQVSGLQPLNVDYEGGVDARRLAASLLIPVNQWRLVQSGIFQDLESHVSV